MFSGGRDTDFRHRLILSHSCVKLDEDTSSALIVRVAERLGAFFSGAVSFGFDVKGVAVVNLLEHDLEPALVSGNKVSIALRPFEIKTFKVTF